MLRSLLLLFLLSCASTDMLSVNTLYKDQVMATVRLVKNTTYIDLKKGVVETKPMTVGSGVILKTDRTSKGKVNLVITARHFCKTPDLILEQGVPSKFVLSAEIEATNYFGKDFKTEFIAYHEKEDVCFVSVLGDVGDSVLLANEYPDLGDELTHVGASEGTFGLNLAYVSSGRFCGFEEREDVVYMTTSVPAVGGSSGGGIYHKGRMVSMLVKSNLPSTAISMGVPLASLHRHLDNIIPIWRSKRQSASKTSASKPSTEPSSIGSTGPSAPT